MRTDAQNSEIRTFLDGRNPVAFFLNALTMALGNVNDASIKLSALYIENLRASAGILTERAVLHYSQQFIGQVYRVLGSADFLGNPVGLFNNVSSGVADIFYQPLNGFVVHGNTDLGYSIAKVSTFPDFERTSELTLASNRVPEALSRRPYLDSATVLPSLLAALVKVSNLWLREQPIC